MSPLLWNSCLATRDYSTKGAGASHPLYPMRMIWFPSSQTVWRSICKLWEATVWPRPLSWMDLFCNLFWLDKLHVTSQYIGNHLQFHGIAPFYSSCILSPCSSIETFRTCQRSCLHLATGYDTNFDLMFKIQFIPWARRQAITSKLNAK